MDPATAARLTRIGRSSSVTAVALAFILAVFILVVFETDHPWDEVEALGTWTAIICAMVFVVTGLGGPTLWAIGLRGQQRDIWPAVLIFVAVIAAGATIAWAFVSSLDIGAIYLF